MRRRKVPIDPPLLSINLTLIRTRRRKAAGKGRSASLAALRGRMSEISRSLIEPERKISGVYSRAQTAACRVWLSSFACSSRRTNMNDP